MLGAALALGAMGCVTVTASPDVAEPGTLVRLHANREVFVGPPGPQVAIGGRVAPLAGASEPRDAAVLVPAVAGGEAPIELVYPEGKRKRVGKMTVQEGAYEEVVLSREGDRVAIVRRGARTSPGHTRASPDELRIAFEVVDARGVVLAAGVIPHPGRVEVFDPPAGGKANIRSARLRSFVFPLRVPASPGETRVRLWELEPGVPPVSAEGKRSGTPIGEVKLPAKEVRP